MTEVTGNELLELLDEAVQGLNTNPLGDVFAFSELVGDYEDVKTALAA